MRVKKRLRNDDSRDQTALLTKRGVRFAPAGHDAEGSLVIFARRRQTDGQDVVAIGHRAAQLQHGHVVPVGINQWTFKAGSALKRAASYLPVRLSQHVLELRVDLALDDAQCLFGKYLRLVLVFGIVLAEKDDDLR